MKRRDFLNLAGAGLCIWSLPSLGRPDTQAKNVVWIVLRGAMDSLHAVVPTFEKDLLYAQRPSLLEPIYADLLTLDTHFALHPSLRFLHSLYVKKQFAPVVAVSTPYRQRSHFDAQDLLESGLSTSDPDNGWLARAAAERGREGLAIARSVPVSLRGKADTRTWYPSNLPETNDDLINRLMGLYEQDTVLRDRLGQALQTESMLENERGGKRAQFGSLASAAARLLKAEQAPCCAMLEMGGWDTHNNLVPRLGKQFEQLDAGLQALHTELGKQWDNTLVIVATEFGRTVKANGTKGSDHGTASCLMLLGGAVKGGRVLGQWPGLASGALFEGRDLQPTSDTFSWIGAALRQHWQLSADAVQRIFPDVKAQTAQLLV